MIRWSAFIFSLVQTFNPLMTMTTRRSAGPLDIVGLPSYEKLSEDERNLCSETRVLPEVFLDIQKILVKECKKSNGLRLADARSLVEIDVNKAYSCTTSEIDLKNLVGCINMQ